MERAFEEVGTGLVVFTDDGVVEGPVRLAGLARRR